MKTYLITFDFAEDAKSGGAITAGESLEEHTGIHDFLRGNTALQLAPNSFLLKTEMSMEKIYTQLISSLERQESLFIFDVGIERYQAFSPPEIREALGAMTRPDLE